MAYLYNIDFTILNYIYNTFSCKLLDTLMPVITAFGNRGMLWILIALFMLAIRKYRINGIILLFALAICALLTNIILKIPIARPRPCWIYEIPLLIPNPTDYSFPSGHTSASFTSAIIIAYSNKKCGIIAYIMALLISFSRLYLYVHFPSDVIAGAIIGTLIGIIVYKLIFSLIKSKNAA